MAEEKIHTHTGTDMPQVEYENILRTPNIVVTDVVTANDARDIDNYNKFFIAPYQCEVTAISEVHTRAESTVTPFALQVQRLQGTEANGNGDDLLTTAFDLTATAETVVSGTLVNTNVKILDKDDRLSLRLQTSSIGSEAQGVVVTALLKRTSYN